MRNDDLWKGKEFFRPYWVQFRGQNVYHNPCYYNAAFLEELREAGRNKWCKVEGYCEARYVGNDVAL